MAATHLAVYEGPGGMCRIVGAGAAVVVRVDMAMVVVVIVVVIVIVIVIVVVGAAIVRGVGRAQCA
jgi:hypothetical protein